MKNVFLWSIILILIFSLGLIGISCKEEVIPKDEGDVIANDEEKVQISEDEEAEEIITLRIMDWQPGGKEFWDKTDSDFMEKYPNISIEHETVPYGQYFEKVGAYISAMNGPDLMQLEMGLGTLKYKDVLNPLNQYVSDILDDITGLDAFCEDFDVSKNIYGVPHTNQGHMMYYNKTVFEEAGLNPDTPPKTWSEFDEAVKAIKSAGKEPIAFGGKEWQSLWTMCNLPNQTMTLEEQKGVWLDTVGWTDKPLYNSVVLLNDMYERGWFSSGAAMTSVTPEAQDMFINGDAAFFNSIISDAFNWKLWDDTMGNANYGVMKFPMIEDGFPIEGISPSPMADKMDVHGGIAFTIPQWSNNIDAAILYIKYVTSPEVQTRYLVEGGAFPSNKKFDRNAIDSEQFKELAKWVAEPGVASPLLLYLSPEEWDGIIRQTQLLITDQITVDEFTSDMQVIKEDF